MITSLGIAGVAVAVAVVVALLVLRHRVVAQRNSLVGCYLASCEVLAATSRMDEHAWALAEADALQRWNDIPEELRIARCAMLLRKVRRAMRRGRKARA